MAATTSAGFATLSPTVSIYTPPSYQKGQLIILCTWMGAAEKHLAKYIRLHQEHRPNSKILHVRSTVPGLISSYAAQRKAMKPAVLAVLAHLDECDFTPGGANLTEPLPHILLHLFSSGGANTATQLLLTLHQALQSPAPIMGLVCDSAPAGGSYWKGYSGFINSLPRRFPANILGPIAIHLILGLLHLNIALGRYEQPEDLWRNTILDETLHADPKDGSHRIAYIASKADKITYWEDVGSHAKLARAKEWQVKEVLYEGTSHCNHMGKDETAYNSIIQAVWERSSL